MKTNYLGKQLNVPNDFKETVERKLKKYDKFFKTDAAAALVLKRRKNNKEVVELTITSDKLLYRAEKEHDTFQNALDACLSSIERQIAKHKTRVQKHLHDGASLRTLILESEYKEEVPAEEQTEYKVREKKFIINPMSVDEAILQMNMLEHTFFLFRDEYSGEIRVVYARNDGDYGLIVPDKK